MNAHRADFKALGDGLRTVDCPQRLDALIEQDRFLSPLPERLVRARDAGVGLVHECEAPVFLHVELVDGVARVRGDVPREAPVARGFVGLLVSVFDEAPITTLRDAPDDVLTLLGLRACLSARRRRGLEAIYRKLRDDARRIQTTNGNRD